MNLLVTGATGEIGGRSLLAQLAARATTRVLSRRARPDAAGLEWVRGDLRDARTLSGICDGVDVVLHLAGVTRARRRAGYVATNVDGTAALVRAARSAGVSRFLYMSSRAVGDGGGAYSESKARAEEEVLKSGLRFVILRPAEVYGADGGDPVSVLARWLEKRSFVFVLGDGADRLSPVYVEDVIGAILRALDHPGVDGRTYVLAGPEEMTYLGLVERLEAILGVPARKRIHVPPRAARALVGLANVLHIGRVVPDQIPRLRSPKSSDIAAARRDLGFAPGRLEECFRLTARPHG